MKTASGGRLVLQLKGPYGRTFPLPSVFSQLACPPCLRRRRRYCQCPGQTALSTRPAAQPSGLVAPRSELTAPSDVEASDGDRADDCGHDLPLRWSWS